MINFVFLIIDIFEALNKKTPGIIGFWRFFFWCGRRDLNCPIGILSFYGMCRQVLIYIAFLLAHLHVVLFSFFLFHRGKGKARVNKGQN